jgi:tetratricopeptide (TPR) repeat protein
MVIPQPGFRRRRSFRVPTVALVLIVTMTVVVPVPARAQDASARGIDAWIGAVTSHVPAARDDAAIDIARWSRDDLDAVSEALDLRQPDEATRLHTVTRALVLHMDIAMLNRTVRGYNLPPDRNTIPLFADGREVGQMSGTYHWPFARRLLQRLPRSEARARDFYRAAAAVLQLWGEHAELALHLNAARGIIDNDPVLLMYEGTMHQVNADARSQRYFDILRQARDRVVIGRMSPQSTVLAPPSMATALQLAERFFRRALAADPALHEARIRLTHVLHERGRHAEAVAEAARVAVVGALPPSLDYYASLVAGRAHRALGDLDAASASFSRALATHPDSRAARTALSELALARGDRAAARALLAPLAGRLLATAEEPWWLTGRIHEPSAQVLVDQLRRRLR